MALAVIFACLHLVIIVICGLDNEYLVLSSSRRKWFLAAYLLGFAMLPLLRYELGSGTSDSSSFRHGTSHKEQVTNDKGQLEKSRDQTHPVSSLSPTGTGLQNHGVDASSTAEAQRQILFLLACMSSGTFAINLLQLASPILSAIYSCSKLSKVSTPCLDAGGKDFVPSKQSHASSLCGLNYTGKLWSTSEK
jgi:hypothetical protein